VHWVFWAMAGAAVVNFLEELFFGWMDSARDIAGRSSIGFARGVSGGVNLIFFVIVNLFFIILCTAGALVGLHNPVFSLSIACLFLINVAMYLVPLIIVRRYSPGAVSVLLLFTPLAAYAFRVTDQAGKLSTWTVLGAFLLGFLWEAIPLAAVFFSSTRERR
jgi:hypothetical protein